MNSLWHILSFPLLIATVLITGCQPTSVGRVDEEREAYYLDAKEKLFALDYQAAVVGFERALEVNPKNAAAHLELGLIYYEHLKDYVSAIYHFNKMLQLRPNHLMAGQIEDHVKRCKMDFASSANLGPLNHNTEIKMKKLVEENGALESKVKNLEGQLAQMREVLVLQKNALNQKRQEAEGRQAKDQMVSLERRSGNAVVPGGSNAPSELRPRSRPTPNRPKYQKHVIRSKDHFYSLSRQYGVSVNAIKAANPGVDSRSLQIGQVVNVPYPTTTASR